MQDAQEELCFEDQKPQHRELSIEKSTRLQDMQRLPDVVQMLLAALLFFAVLLAAEGASGAGHRQNSWLQMLWCREPWSSADMDNSSVVVGTLFPSGKQA